MHFRKSSSSSRSSRASTTSSTPSSISSFAPSSVGPGPSTAPTSAANTPAVLSASSKRSDDHTHQPPTEKFDHDAEDPAMRRRISSKTMRKSTILPPPEPPKLHEVPPRSPFGALLSRTLPHYTGPHPVGVCDIEIPVARRTFGTFRHKSLPDAEAGLAMDTVLFSLFYPCQLPEKPTPVAWFPKLSQTIDGFLKMAKRTPNVWYRMLAYPLAAAAIHGTTFPACKDAPLAEPPSTPADTSKVPHSAHITTPEGSRWPLMIFSHGVGCSRLMYSAFCGEMASRGYVVAVLEHRDGTSPSSTIAAADGTTTVVDWVQWSDLYWPELEEQPTDDTTLRHEQIKLRVAEVEAVVDIMRKLSAGEQPLRYSIDAPDFDWDRWKRVDCSRPIMAGHSLGGSAALAASSRSNIDFRAVVVFDPAVQRLQPWRSPLPHPLLVVDSEEFTVGHEYQIFSSQILHTITTPGSPQVFSIGGATHPSFSDVFLILPGAINRLTGLSAPAPSVIARAVRAVEQFLGGEGGWGGRVGYEEVYRGEGERKMKMGEAARRARSKSRSKRMLGFGRKKGSGSEGESGGGESGDKDADAEEVLQEKGKGGRLYRPVTTPGQLAWHRL